MNLTRTFAAALEGASPSVEPDAEIFTIGDMARTFGVSLRTLRFYEDRGLLKPFRNGTTRLYDGRARLRLQMILKGKQLGFTLAEIHDMLKAKGDEAMPEFELSLQPDQVLAQISLLQRQRESLDHAIEELKATHERLAAAIGAPEHRSPEAKAG